MAIVRPFKALRPNPTYAEQVVSLPYDVMNREEASKMAENNPYSFLHVCRSEIDLPEEENPYSHAVYLKAKRNMEEFIEKGIFFKDENPCLYIYRQVMDGRTQTGIVGCASIDDYQNNIIKKHEFTRYEKELDRINHFDICNANTEPVFLTYRKNHEIDAIVLNWISENKPVYDFKSNDNIHHTLWVLDDYKKIEAITALFESIDSLYIADGHHRTASAVKVGLKRREEHPDYTGEEEFNYFMAAIFPDSDLKIFDYNRVVEDLNGLTSAEFLDRIQENFEVNKVEADMPYQPKQKHEFGMFLENQWYRLIAKKEIIDDSDFVKSLDVSVLQDYLLSPVLGIHDPRKDKRIDFVGGIRGLKELERRVKGGMKAAFALYPVSIEDLLNVSDKGLIMPPKSTWFEPKLGSGLFIHEL